MALEISSSKGAPGSPTRRKWRAAYHAAQGAPCQAMRSAARCAALACPMGHATGRGVAQPGSASHWGCGGRRFESCRPDHFRKTAGHALDNVADGCRARQPHAICNIRPMPRRRRRKSSWPARIALAILAIPAALSLRRAGRRAGPGQSRLARARRGHHHLPRRQWRPRRPGPAGRRRRASTGAPLLPQVRLRPTCPPTREWIAFGAGERRVYLETPTWGDLTPQDRCGRADRRRAGDACRMDRRPGLCRARDPPDARTISPPVGRDPRRLRARRATASRSASTIPATARATPSTKASAGPTRSTPATNGPPAASASPGSRRRCGRRSSRGWCGGIGKADQST